MTAKDAKQAKAALECAKQHFKRACANPDDPDEVFVWSFYALENAVVAASIQAAEEREVVRAPHNPNRNGNEIYCGNRSPLAEPRGQRMA